MTTAALNRSTRHVQGFELFVLRNECVEAVVVPELGGKVISLTNLRTGRDWFAPEQTPRLFRNQPGDDFAASTLLGWDECLPTIAQCEVNGRTLPDHGELWTAPWQIEMSASDELRLSVSAWENNTLESGVRPSPSPQPSPLGRGSQASSLSISQSVAVKPSDGGQYSLSRGERAGVRGNDAQACPEPQSRPFRFVRTLSLTGSVLTADYALTNESDSPERFLWAMHPLITPHAGDRVELTDESRRQLNAPWLDTLEFGPGVPAYEKVFARDLTEGRAAVVNDRSGERLQFEWSTAENNTLGIWLTRGGWNGCHHLALEPTNAPTDSLATVDPNDPRVLLAPRETKNWTVRLQLDSRS